MSRNSFHGLLISAALTIACSPAMAQDAQRGRLLYDTGCIECHGRSVFSRTDRIARDYDGIRAQVLRWQKNNGLPWTASEVEDVAAYLNATVYKFKLP
jgi:mono/diheme cytochrome c family protein